MQWRQVVWGLAVIVWVDVDEKSVPYQFAQQRVYVPAIVELGELCQLLFENDNSLLVWAV